MKSVSSERWCSEKTKKKSNGSHFKNVYYFLFTRNNGTKIFKMNYFCFFSCIFLNPAENAHRAYH